MWPVKSESSVWVGENSRQNVGLVIALRREQLESIVPNGQTALVSADADSVAVGQIQRPGDLESDCHAIFQTNVAVGKFLNIKLFHVELSGSEQTGGSSALRIGELNILLLVDDPGHSTSTDGNHLRVTGN